MPFLLVMKAVCVKHELQLYIFDTGMTSFTVVFDGA